MAANWRKVAILTGQQFDVCIITTIHGDYDNRIYQRQLDALVGDGMKVCMVAPWDFSTRRRQDFGYVRLRPAGSRLSRPRHGLRTMKAALSVDARVYIFHDAEFLPYAAELKRRSGAVVIYDCHENIPEDIRHGKDWIPKPLRPPISVSFRMVEETVARYLGRVIVVVPHQYRRFSRLGIKVSLVRNLPNFEAPENFEREEAVLYTGSLSRDYGFYLLLEIGREMKRRGIKVPLRIVDRFYKSEHLRAEMVEAIEKEGLHIEFIKPCRAEDMPKLLAKGSIGISPLLDTPNKALAYPTKVFEYFAYGLVTIASDIEGTREILEPGDVGILVPARDIKAWVDKIEVVLNDQDVAAGYRKRARDAYLDHFNWAKERKVLVNFVREALEEAPPRKAIA